ncbi:hypothetical protein Q1695_003111 [Nippostrongylus brasiliensis]|nr:hypothetical protein Q1695_003111 [Nippostrongylus brasiliensis]
MGLSTQDTVFVMIMYVLSACGFVLNSLLLFLIIFKSPLHLTPYKIFLADTAITQLLASIVYMLLSPRILSTGFNIIVIYLGPSQYLGQVTCYMLYTTMLHLSINAFMSWLVSMIYRYMSVKLIEVGPGSVFLMCAAAYVIPISMVATSVNLQTSNNATEADVLTHHVIPEMTSYRMVITADVRQAGILYSILCCSALVIPIYITILVCRRKIYTQLQSVSHSPQTKLNVQRLVKALTMQSLIPVVAIFPPVTAYLLLQFDLIGVSIPSYLIAPCASIGPLLDPVITTYYVYPYRMFVERHVLRWKEESAKVQQRTSNAA